jgi:hypothetical protein
MPPESNERRLYTTRAGDLSCVGTRWEWSPVLGRERQMKIETNAIEELHQLTDRKPWIILKQGGWLRSLRPRGLWA